MTWRWCRTSTVPPCTHPYHPAKGIENASSSHSSSLEHAPSEHRESRKHNVAGQVAVYSQPVQTYIARASLSGTVNTRRRCYWPVAQRAGAPWSGDLSAAISNGSWYQPIKMRPAVRHGTTRKPFDAMSIRGKRLVQQRGDGVLCHDTRRKGLVLPPKRYAIALREADEASQNERIQARASTKSGNRGRSVYGGLSTSQTTCHGPSSRPLIAICKSKCYFRQ
jgi:hypothetical protein